MSTYINCITCESKDFHESYYSGAYYLWENRNKKNTHTLHIQNNTSINCISKEKIN